MTWKWSHLKAKSTLHFSDCPAGYVGVLQFATHAHQNLWWTLQGFSTLSIFYESNLSTVSEMILRRSSSINWRNLFTNEAQGKKKKNCSVTFKHPYIYRIQIQHHVNWSELTFFPKSWYNPILQNVVNLLVKLFIC